MTGSGQGKTPYCPVGHVLGLRERKKLEAWRTIRSTALRLISERGFDAVSVEDIATEAGVSRTTFFSYFRSKEAVVYDLDPQELQQWRELLADAPRGEPLWEALTGLVLSLAELLADRLPLQKRLFQQSPELCDSSRDVCDSFGPDLREWVARRTPEGDELHAALVLNTAFAAFNTAIEAWDHDDSFDHFLDLARDCLRLAGSGLARPVS
ncbi:TetR family transcriptional regulator [Modestobacter sp. VKM Ac-2983]|uniref:TetR family transcriptional regulator n=1 Tax=Modestobacter sp. VKM Ac-2983 TaxID=3004137 RepID=UPI0022ABA604|nr:TetR family transcriptional regulator [Modestobacter sp. VKM Ac-2983]MCZ2804370.1 TetR family transcriptional regulator [Modestobacter sp. VKM Ac-2983]